MKENEFIEKHIKELRKEISKHCDKVLGIKLYNQDTDQHFIYQTAIKNKRFSVVRYKDLLYSIAIEDKNPTSIRNIEYELSKFRK